MKRKEHSKRAFTKNIQLCSCRQSLSLSRGPYHGASASEMECTSLSRWAQTRQVWWP